MTNDSSSKSPPCVNVVKGENGVSPIIEITESDCSGRIPETVMAGRRIMRKAERDHKRYWREMVGTYLRNELGLCPELPSNTVFKVKFPKSYELYGAIRGSGEWDFYLFGFHKDDTMEKFDSPANFVMHARWLAYGRPIGACKCKPCSGTPQLDISKRLTLGGAKIDRPFDSDTAARSEKVRG